MNSYIDMHCDTLQRTFTQGASSLYDGEGMQSIKLMQEAKTNVSVLCRVLPAKRCSICRWNH